VPNLKDDMNYSNLKRNHRARILVGIIIMLLIAAMHGFRIGQLLSGDLHRLYYSFASDLVLPIGAYFLLCMNESHFRFLRKWYIKSIIVFVVMTFSEIMQAFDIYFFGVTFDLLDILMFGIGTLFAVILDKVVFESLIPYWKYSK
jgi:hypothetical protein